MRNLHMDLIDKGIDSYIFWGRRHETINDHEQCCGSKCGVYYHGIMARFFDRMGFYSKRDTARLLQKFDDIDPDVVHLHNIHGYYVNIEMLFEWLAQHRCQVRWTLHDCWAFTGHCAYFTYVTCAQWQVHCAHENPCCQLATYPKTYSKRSCARNFADKKRLFNMIPADRMKLIAPSQWLADLVEQSFLSNYSVEVRHNTVDASIFKPTPGDFRERYGIGNRFMILGVASPWTERKGLGDFFSLAEELDLGKFAIVLVGLDKNQISSTPSGFIGIKRTESKEELAELYSAADVFFNPTKEDNYPTVNLEAEACGTSVVTYDTGGCSETIKREDSYVVSGYDDAVCLLQKIQRSKSLCSGVPRDDLRQNRSYSKLLGVAK